MAKAGMEYLAFIGNKKARAIKMGGITPIRQRRSPTNLSPSQIPTKHLGYDLSGLSNKSRKLAIAFLDKTKKFDDEIFDAAYSELEQGLIGDDDSEESWDEYAKTLKALDL